MFDKIDKILSNNASKYSPGMALEASRICFVAESESKGAFKAISFKNGILKVAVKNDIVAQEIRMESSKLIYKINSLLGADKIKRIIYNIGHVK
jgi:hypothetical protein